MRHKRHKKFVEDAVAAGLGSSDDIRGRLKEQAEGSFVNILEGIDAGQVNIEG